MDALAFTLVAVGQGFVRENCIVAWSVHESLDTMFYALIQDISIFLNYFLNNDKNHLLCSSDIDRFTDWLV